MRSSLRAGTRSVRDAARLTRGESVFRVGSMLPANVLGHDLAMLMSEPLRRALRPTPSATDEARAPRRTANTAEPGAPAVRRRIAEDLHAPRTGQSRESGIPPPRSSSLPDGSSSNLASPWLTNTTMRARTSLSADLRTAISPEPQPDPAATPFASQAVESRTPGATAAAQSPLLAAKLREYRELNRRVEARVRGPQTEAMTHESSPLAAPNAVSSSPDARSAEFHSPQLVEERLRRFASMRLPREAATLRARAVGPTPGFESQGADPGRSRSASHAATQSADDSWALSQRLADILREQAIEHGIDLT